MTLCSKVQCTGCGACFNRCAKGAISMVADEDGFAYPQIDAGKCVGCGLCQRACPQLVPPPFHPPMGKKVYAAWAKDDAIRLASSSGGLYTVFAQEILKRGGLVNGVAYDKDFNLTHRLVDKAEDLAALRGSKYVQSDIGDIYRRVEQVLKDGQPVLFTSTPCQVAGLYSFLGKPYDNLVTCDFVCHGVPSPAFFKESVRHNEGTCFRKLPGWGYNPEMEYGVYFRAFKWALSLRESCYRCRYASFSRVSDLTIGDFGGVGTWWPFVHHDAVKGVSVLLVNSEKGRSFVDAVSEHDMIYERRDVHECEQNHQLYFPVRRPLAQVEFYARMRERGFNWAQAEIGKMRPEEQPVDPLVRRCRSFLSRAIGYVIKRLVRL